MKIEIAANKLTWKQDAKCIVSGNVNASIKTVEFVKMYYLVYWVMVKSISIRLPLEYDMVMRPYNYLKWFGPIVVFMAPIIISHNINVGYNHEWVKSLISIGGWIIGGLAIYYIRKSMPLKVIKIDTKNEIVWLKVKNNEILERIISQAESGVKRV